MKYLILLVLLASCAMMNSTNDARKDNQTHNGRILHKDR
jgi:hypothetical protein